MGGETMIEDRGSEKKSDRNIPRATSCAACAKPLEAAFGWCSTCRQALCFECGRAHFCTPTCRANGCLAGLCVRLVENGRFSATWGLPDASERTDG
jgi:hypothetical protein